MRGWLGPQAVGGCYQTLNIKPDFFPALEFEHSLEDGLDLLGWSSGLDFPLEDCKQEVKEGEAVLCLPGTTGEAVGITLVSRGGVGRWWEQ